MKIPFVDLKRQHTSIKCDIEAAIKTVIDDSAFISGSFVRSFERAYAAVHGAAYCVGVNSGTSALHLAMWCLGIGQDDEVIVPANTFFATPEAVSLCGATPVFVDCEPDYFNIAPDKIRSAVTKKTKAIIAVHLYGQPAMLKEIKALADENDLLLIEDCAQAHIAEYDGVPVGTYGACGCFSFYPAKNLGAIGEAGAVVTNDEDLCKKMLTHRDHGSSRKYFHDYVGHNYRMEGIQGAVLNIKLKHLKDWTEKRRWIADKYRSRLKELPDLVLPEEMHGSKHVYHLFVVRTKRRDGLNRYLENAGIGTGIHYPIPCHRQKAYRFLSYPDHVFPISETFAGEILSLPMYAELTEKEIEFVCCTIKQFFGD